ncbi:MAG: hypothetical protein KDC47_00910 [Flavobacteriaceae bacterium]|nr:hypothetical protein [Flavobacteriaceae bacterium]
MRTLHKSFILNYTKRFLLLSVLLLVTSFTTNVKEENDTQSTATYFKDALWQVKAVHPEGYFLDVRAVDVYGNAFEVKALQDTDQKSFMDVIAIVENKMIPIKILINDGKFAPVKAISDDGTTFTIKAITKTGDRINLKGVRRSGNIVHIRAVNLNGSHYSIKAISPNGEINDVRGVKISGKDLEYSAKGINVYAHVKAMPQTGDIGDNFLWHIVGVDPNGYLININAYDSKGNSYSIKAIQDSDQRSLLDVKVFYNENEQLSVKLILTNDKLIPIKAIGEKGELFDIMATLQNGEKMRIFGQKVSGNIIPLHIYNAKNEIVYQIKAISPEGELNDVKGVKILRQPLEMDLNGVSVYAHVKALSPSTN